MIKKQIVIFLTGFVLSFGIGSGSILASDLSMCQPSGYKSDCFAVVTYDSGEIYIGEFQDNRRHGQGTLAFDDGRQYVGNWKDDKFNGQGMETYPSGNKYIGEFKNNKKHGQGTLTFANGNAALVGMWKENTLQAVKHQKQKPVKTTKNLVKKASDPNIKHGLSLLYLLAALIILFFLWMGYEWHSQSSKKQQKQKSRSDSSKGFQQKKKKAKSETNSKILMADLAFFGINQGYSFAELKTVRNAKLKQNHPDKVAQMSNEIKNVAEQQTERINNVFVRLEKRLLSSQN